MMVLANGRGKPSIFRHKKCISFGVQYSDSILERLLWCSLDSCSIWADFKIDLKQIKKNVYKNRELILLGLEVMSR